MKPEILTHPNIPKPLHGLNPRTVLGREWWDYTRFEAQKRTDYTCSACGVHKTEAKYHKWLEGHEFWDINYETGVCEVKSIEPLCHSCHNFIHSGRLVRIIGKEKTMQQAVDILEQGFAILASNNLKCFRGTWDLARAIGADTFGVTFYDTPSSKIGWNDWVMLLEGKEYQGKFNSYEEWENYYGRN